MCDLLKMELDTFQNFPELPSELCIKIWKFAGIQEGPRTVEVATCSRDHNRGIRYIKHSTEYPEADHQDCCFHFK